MTQRHRKSHGRRIEHPLRARKLGIDSHSEALVFLHRDSAVCRSEGFSAHNRILLCAGDRRIVATLYQVTDSIIGRNEAGLSDVAWERLGLSDGDEIEAVHPPPLDSLSLVRSRIYGNALDKQAFREIIGDIVAGDYSDIHIASFVTACATKPLDAAEVLSLTEAMVESGDRLSWNKDIVVDKHSVGGLPGNRTTPIVVAIMASLGLTMPKTSSRAITSPAGTADTMETLAPVDLDPEEIHRVVEQEGGCVVWGGAVNLSPADDILIRVERALDLDSEGQLIASVLSKKAAAGATHLVLDMPVGPTAKVRSTAAAMMLEKGLLAVAQSFGMRAVVVVSDGNQPVGHGIGPALEARDVLAVLNNHADAPTDLRDRALKLAGALLELANAAPDGHGIAVARSALQDGRAARKFEAICTAQGGRRTPPVSTHRRDIAATRSGRIDAIDNRKIAKLAKLAGAPEARAAGVEMHARLGDVATSGRALCTVHAETPGELDYALSYAAANADMFWIEDI